MFIVQRVFIVIFFIFEGAHVLAANGQDVERYARFFINQSKI
jgi:hypothetical protein